MKIQKALVKGMLIFTIAAPACGMTLNAIHAEGTATTTETTATTTQTTDTNDQTTVKSGWQSDGTYYDPTTHVLLKGLQKIDNVYYYLDDTTGVKKVNAWVGDSYFDQTGKRCENGAYTLNGANYYFKAGVKVKNSWIGNAYYDTKGVRYESGKKTISGKIYYFKNGAKVVKTWVGNSYYGSDGALVTNGYVVKNGKTLYLVNGKFYSGVTKVNGAFRYFTKGAAYTKTGWKRTGSTVYYFNKGKGVTGLKKIGKYYYYFNPSNAKLYRGFKTVGKNYYYFKKSGKYFTTYGAAATGLFKLGGKTYYANNKGQLARNQSMTINGKKYNFNSRAQATKVVTLDAITKKASKYSSPTKYLMMVDTSKHRVYAFTGSKNNWKRVKTFVCSNGKASTPTKHGVFHIGTTPGRYKRARYFTENTIRCWYATRIVNGILFHSVLYTISSSPTTIHDGRLGMSISHGCVRLALNNAKWIYDNVPNNTTVVIY